MRRMMESKIGEHLKRDIKSVKPSEPTFVLAKQGVFWVNVDVDADELDRYDHSFICRPLVIQAYTRDQNSDMWGRLLWFRDADGMVHEWAMPARLLAGTGEDLRRDLLDLGLIISSSATRRLLVDYILQTESDKRIRCVERTGWFRKVYVLPGRVIGEDNEGVILQSVSGLASRLTQNAGQLNDWQLHLAKPCAGNTRAVFAISTAFAAITLVLVNAEPGGFHFVGMSSIGKTTLLRVACSVHGGPNRLYPWRTTVNGLEGIAALHNDSLLTLDELSQIDGREAGEVAYMLANGRGKSRANRTGGIRRSAEWQLIFLSSGERGLSDHMAQSHRRAKAGQLIRLLDIPADTGKFGIFDTLHDLEDGAAFANRLKDDAESYYGTAGPGFITRVAEDIHAAATALRQYRNDWLTTYLPETPSEQVRRAAGRFAHVAAAGELATKFGITGWKRDEAARSAAACFRAWLDERGGAGSAERAAALDQVTGFIQTHGAARFEEMDGSTRIPVRDRAGYKSSNEYLIFPKAFREEICVGLNARYVAGVLEEEGMLVRDSGGKYTHARRLPGLGQKRMYVITLADEDDDSSACSRC